MKLPFKFNFNPFEKKYQYIGLHINAHAIKALQFERKRGRTSLRGYVNAALPKGLMTNDAFTDKHKLADFIKLTLASPQQGSFNTNRVVVCVPESKSFIRVMEMPLVDEAKAENAIMFEAEAYIPMPMDQVYFDWQIISKSAKTMSVLVIASPKEYVDTITQLIEDAGLKLCAVEVEAQSVTRALVPQAVDEPVLLVDMDAFKTAMIIVENNVLQFTSSVPVAGDVFTEKLAQTLAIKPEEAEKLKREVGLANTVKYPELKSALMPGVTDMAAEIKNVLKFHYDHSESHVNQILLTGGGAKLQHIGEVLPALLEQYAPLTVTVANPLEHLPNLEHSPLTPYEALSFTTAIGLAMWGIQE
ncbi:MAG TPA: type IV pilus assembly protein PilM [Patescibacteria group bacterium]|jgi:type IV pilus assembly protein PilM|nr:type IV pilus assembly protein PilM [Patescibacteria group bacterium]